MNARLATPKQRNLVHSLADERVLDDAVRVETHRLAEQGDLSFVDVKRLIDGLFARPKKPREARPTRAHLTGLPHANYAFMVAQLRTVGVRHLVARADREDALGFFRVAEYKGVVYMRQLFGAPGSFNRERLERVDEEAVARLIAVNPLEATQRFADHYQICGKCGAELTDPVSLAARLGPTCRTAFGL